MQSFLPSQVWASPLIDDATVAITALTALSEFNASLHENATLQHITLVPAAGTSSDKQCYNNPNKNILYIL